LGDADLLGEASLLGDGDFPLVAGDLDLLTGEVFFGDREPDLLGDLDFLLGDLDLDLPVLFGDRDRDLLGDLLRDRLYG